MNQHHGLDGQPLLHLKENLPDSDHPIARIGLEATRRIIEKTSFDCVRLNAIVGSLNSWDCTRISEEITIYLRTSFPIGRRVAGSHRRRETSVAHNTPEGRVRAGTKSVETQSYHLHTRHAPGPSILAASEGGNDPILEKHNDLQELEFAARCGEQGGQDGTLRAPVPSDEAGRTVLRPSACVHAKVWNATIVDHVRTTNAEDRYADEESLPNLIPQDMVVPAPIAEYCKLIANTTTPQGDLVKAVDLVLLA
ncbi:hypothetical protein WN48_09689 [Eufriesea mexicana]|uniref:Uncharacterized protein n=1 Tax=Eufriesea mexicana TaxID=516756 RepID=A0A310SII3_9HYME|nr:hypothetical protein WN48_09689 [Eufriesea mexicana]